MLSEMEIRRNAETVIVWKHTIRIADLGLRIADFVVTSVLIWWSVSKA